MPAIIFNYVVLLPVLFLASTLMAAEPKQEPTQQTPLHPQSHEAIKQMGDQMEAERKAREAEKQKVWDARVKERERKEAEEKRKAEEEKRKGVKHYPAEMQPKKAVTLPSGSAK